ncbi:MAG: hypothetical protein DRN81_06835 [Thermoproteota archaeon]|nr:MAG: hypothetical protein DRN81_06835 [Candidatus Korarchaeota archaeon]
MRITQKMLEMSIERLNNIKGFKKEVKFSTIGAFVLDYAYGGVSLHQWVNEHGGIRDVFSCGHVTKRDLYNRINSLIIGIEGV